MTTAIFGALLAAFAVLVSIAGLPLRQRALPRMRAASGPYRAPMLEIFETSLMPPGARFGAVGSVLLAVAAVPTIVIALLHLRWENIGVTLFPALLLVVARLASGLALLRKKGVEEARLVARASLLLDFPLFCFSAVHVQLVEDGLHGAPSLAVVAGAFALADGTQAALLLLLLD